MMAIEENKRKRMDKQEESGEEKENLEIKR
jgi:hypothetical protein